MKHREGQNLPAVAAYLAVFLLGLAFWIAIVLCARIAWLWGWP